MENVVSWFKSVFTGMINEQAMHTTDQVCKIDQLQNNGETADNEVWEFSNVFSILRTQFCWRRLFVRYPFPIFVALILSGPNFLVLAGGKGLKHWSTIEMKMRMSSL